MKRPADNLTVANSGARGTGRIGRGALSLPSGRIVSWRKPVAALLAVAMAAAGGSAANAAAPPSEHPVAAFQQREAYLYAIGYRLALANVAFCQLQQHSIGVLLHDAQAYPDPVVVRAVLGLTDDIGVQAVAPQSPAAKAGVAANATLVSINGARLWDSENEKGEGWERAARLNRALGSPLPVQLAWKTPDGRSGDTSIQPIPVCASDFELKAENDTAIADGKRVLVGAEFPAFAYGEDELAAAVAHEMAHNLLGHIDFLDRAGRKRDLVRLSERDADRLMPWLLANAGYDPAAATRFMRRWGPRHAGGIFRKRTHDGWDERVDLIDAEVKAINRLRGDQGHAPVDWSVLFTPLLDVTAAQQP